jgi:hypothetical protein
MLIHVSIKFQYWRTLKQFYFKMTATNSLGDQPREPSDSPTESSELEEAGLTHDVRDSVPFIQLVMILIPLTLFYFLVLLDNSIITTAIPAITTEFNSLLDVGWYVIYKSGR